MELEKLIQRFEIDASQGIRELDRFMRVIDRFAEASEKAHMSMDSTSRSINQLTSASKNFESALHGDISALQEVKSALRGVEQQAEKTARMMLRIKREQAHLDESREVGATPMQRILSGTRTRFDRVPGTRGASPADMAEVDKLIKDYERFFSPEFIAKADASYRKGMARMAGGNKLGATKTQLSSDAIDRIANEALQKEFRAIGPGGLLGVAERQIQNQVTLAKGARPATAAELRLLKAGKFKELNTGIPAKETGSGDDWFRRGAWAGLSSIGAGTAGGLVSAAGLPWAGGGIAKGGMAGALAGSLIAPGIGTVAGAGIGGALGGLAGLPFDILTKGIGALTAAFEKLISVGSGIASMAVSTGMEFERIRISFETMTGSIEKGNRLFKELQQLDVKSPFDLETLSRASNILLAAGTGAESVIPTLERLQDMAGGSSDRLIHLANDLERVSLTGRVTAREMRAFATVGIGIKDLAETLGKSEAQVRFMMNQGRLGSGVIVDTFNRLTNAGGRFFGMTERYLQTVPGQWNQLKETFGQMLGFTAVEGFNKFGVPDILGNVTGFINENSKSIIEGTMAVLERLKVVAEEVWNIFKAIGQTIMQSFGADSFESMLPSLEKVREVTKSILDMAANLSSVFAKVFLEIASMASRLLTIMAPLIKFLGTESPKSNVPGMDAQHFNPITGERMSDDPIAIRNEKFRKSVDFAADGLREFAGALKDVADGVPRAMEKFWGNLNKSREDKFNPLDLNWKGVPAQKEVGEVLDMLRATGGQKPGVPFNINEQQQQLIDRLLGLDKEKEQSSSFRPLGLDPTVVGNVLGKAFEKVGVGLETFLGKELAQRVQNLGRELIPKHPAIDADAEAMIRPLLGQMKTQGTSPLERFQIMTENIAETLNPKSGADPLPNAAQAKHLRFQAFQTLRQGVGVGQDRLPVGALRDSQQAGDIIARDKSGDKSIQQQILETMHAARKQQEIMAEAEKQTVTLLEQYLKKNPLPPRNPDR